MKNSHHTFHLPARCGTFFQSICIGLFILCVILMSFRSLSGYNYGKLAGRATTVTQIQSAEITVNGESKTCSLPTKLTDLEPGTPVDVTFTWNNTDSDAWMQVRTAFAPLTVYENGVEVFSFGSEDTRPSFMKDPGTMIQFVQIQDEGNVKIILHYTSPTTRNSLNITSPVISNQSGLFRYDFQRLGSVMFEGIILLIAGVILAAVSALVIQLIHEGIILFCLGIFTAVTGLWGISNCDFMVFYFNDPNLWYIISYACFFSFILPLEMFLEEGVQFHARKIFRSLRYGLAGMMAVTVILQLTGTVMFSQSVRIYQVLLPVSILAFTVGVIWEAARYRNRMAGQMIPGMLILSWATIAELCNYGGSVGYDSSFYFLLGTSIFFLYMCVVGAQQTRRSYEIRRKAQEQERQLMLMNEEIMGQKKYQDTLLDHERQLRRLRHDYRHQITVLQEFIKNGETEELSDYLNEMMHAIPQSSGTRYSQNIAVNAVVAYYASRAEEKEIQTDIDIQLPAVLSLDMEQSLCVVFGNLLENACEAVERIDTGHENTGHGGTGREAGRIPADRKDGASGWTSDDNKGGEDAGRFIRLSAVEHMGNLIIHMENSMDGKIRKWGRFYLSSKRQEVGIGLSSISNIAEMNGGSAQFNGEQGVFVSDVYMKLYDGTRDENLAHR